MWSPDSEIGYTNKPHFKGYAHGIIPIQTDNMGFRWNGSDTRKSRDSRRRIVYMGDSIMWGVGVLSQSDTISGTVQQYLGDNFEIINAGVVGYSTLQEWLYLTGSIAAVEPDEIVINWCYNDFLPTEDPFGNVRSIHIKYLENIRSNRILTDVDDGELVRFIEVFENTGQRVWDQVNYSSDQRLKQLCLRTCVDLPIVRMADFCKDRGIRLTYLMIPSFMFSGDHQFFYHYFSNLLKENRIETIDVVPLINALNTKTMNGNLGNTDVSARLPLPAFFLRDWADFIRIRSFHKTHRNQIFFDHHHLTVKGNRIVARILADHHREFQGSRSPTTLPPKTCSPS